MVVEQLFQRVPGGSGTYIVELARALREQGTPVVGLCASHGRQSLTVNDDLSSLLALRQFPLPRTALYEAWNWLGRPRAESVVPEAEVVHATTWAVPATRLPLAVTVHDLAFLRSPDHFTRRGNSYFRRCLQRVVAEADRVIVPSRATADDCLAAGIPAHRVEVVPHGVRTRPVLPEQVQAFRTAHGLHRGYVLWTGTREPRKNLGGLLRAFSLFATRHSDIDLVLVGPVGWGQDGGDPLIPPSLKDRVHVLGRLSDEDLAAAYRGARAFCFPSHWEGFGLPVLEAMAYGTPVVTSRGTCMEEVCGPAGLLAAPDDAEAIASRLGVAVGPEHDELAAAGLERAATFTWARCAQEHVEVFRSLAGGSR